MDWFFGVRGLLRYKVCILLHTNNFTSYLEREGLGGGGSFTISLCFSPLMLLDISVFTQEIIWPT